ncbi:MAG: hypothetical protein ACKVT2_04745 [Saprospiraceae bacterium]
MKKEILDDDLPIFLKELKEKGEGLKIPEGYFEAMEEAVFARLKSAGDLDRPVMKLAKRPGFKFYVRPRTATALAAALALVLAAVWFFSQPTVVQPLPLVSTELTEDDLESYVLENVHEFDLEQLAALNGPKSVNSYEESTPGTPKKNRAASDDIRPEDLEKILDEMTDEELEQIL